MGVSVCVCAGAERNCSSSTHTLTNSHSPTHPPRLRCGFTLLEILISMVILLIAMTVAWQTFSTATRAWKGGRETLDKVHHGDFVIGQTASALRSMAFFKSKPEKYAFRIENNRSGYGEHTISWVTGSSAFIPPGEAVSHGLHRIEVGGGEDEDGNEGLLVTIWPYLADEEKVEKQSWLVSENIKGLSCKVYDTKEGEEGWKDTWEYSNAIPGLVEITLYAEPVEKNDEPVKFRQIIEIPLGPLVTNDISAAK
ncbi:MAG TPA: prepilin-type N-terminal cleavage/methylation domain-containing protein [Pontiellaceae bacterium]|nr:prepilin-type N-terminal cleavage/methylation domain-containing protein [Pontiellaceae bacterium]HPR82992.1 prepilin-type N-terminal cleavage/methylation domain-containing protein [Pontiellaceae bacterium]